ncbi:MAG: hypothetical protein K0B11_04580 [Mariniphaga sp.]|nr:hypothetical protein [Mariniphaga sp.]
MRLFVVVFILLGVGSPATAQRSNGLTVEGAVSVEEGSVDGAIIQMYRDGRRLDNYGIGSNGNYKVELNYNHEWTLIFSRPGNFPRKIVVNTHVPAPVLQTDPRFPPFPLNIRLFTEIAGIDRTFSENTVMKIYYSQNVDNFISDLYYNEAQIKHLIDQAILQSQQLGREADYLAGLTKAELAELQKEYDQHIREAENEYRNEEFLKALDGYQAASKIFPKQQYPRDRIAEINDLLGLLMVAEEMQQARAERLAVLIKQADALFASEKYPEARNAYHRALSVDPNNSHAQQRADEINEIIRRQQIDQGYQNLIVQADNSFKELLYVEARNTFQKALDLKQNEDYPKQKINEIDGILSRQTQNAEQLKNYEDAVFQAELNFEKQFYERAISFYESALTHKPDDEMATSRIQEIKDLMNELANRTMYDKLIKSADRSFQRKQYNEAMNEYEHAAELLPNEDYPKNQISRINEIFAEQARLIAEAEAAEQARLAALQAEQDRQYSLAVSRGDSAFNLNEFETSRMAYQSALQVKPDETYPQQRIAEIGQILAQLASAQQNYDAAILRADRDFQSESFESAKAAYTEAQQAKPEETYPAEQIAKIDSIVETRARLAAEAEAEQARLIAEAEAAEQARLAALQAEQDRQYAQAVSRGDSAFNLNEFETSRTAYQSALKVKPDETYPQKRIEEIGSILQEQDRINTTYQNAVALADQQFNSRAYIDAKNNYGKALEIKPEESYPQEKMMEVNRILAQQELDENYRTIILAADGFFNTESWNEARAEYGKALEIKPDENYPKSQIVKIDNLLRQQQERALAEQRAAENMERRRAEIEQRQQQMSERQEMSESGLNQLYNEYISLADGFFDNQRYNVSRAWYYKAWDVKPEETYPPQRIEEINRLVGSLLLSQRDRDYQNFVNLADSTFRENQLAVARGWYNRALSVKSEETYPREQLQAIADLIAERMASRSGEQFNTHMQNASEAFENGNYNVARFWYKKAMELRPDDQQAKEGLLKIEEALN